ncbi:PREDICTED: uncharacterized protein LOC108556711 isoform X1 [Nicrophorus vespilloides]|uniref:Uncharacterized protein LOC108556711 isoform X1 n=1 Tax=Nicrophorus vespilloides TaxID=110193 RepID=A0ABM1M1G0_NICVS|nr:PREDICTED: uncharacterized protein LOC108556711 isoform X1 [Nicrophorus vespilloides]
MRFVAVRKGTGTAGPVFINPAAYSPPVAANAVSQPNQGSQVTQTVYGFLDFTTTIGNTVMVFSPQTAAAAAAAAASDGGKDKVSGATVKTVIETKPVASEPSVVIKPSKTEKKASEPSKKVSSVVQVQPVNPPVRQSSKVEIKSSGLSTKVNVIEGISSVVNVAPPIISSKVEVVEAAPSKQPKLNIISKVEIITGVTKPTQVPAVSSHVAVHQPIFSSKIEVHSDEEPAVIIGNNIAEAEYDFLSRQPSEVVEETYKVINLKPSSKLHLKPRPSAHQTKNKANAATKRGDSLHPTGLVTKLGGTVVKDGTTTVHETSVIGTYISGKYAQVLQSTSHIYNNQHKGKINPSPTLRILKTAAPHLGKHNKHRHLDPTPAASVNEETVSAEISQNTIKSTRKPSGSSGSLKRFKNRQPEPVQEKEKEPEVHTTKKSSRNRQTQSTRSNKHHTQQKQQKVQQQQPQQPSPKYGRNKSHISTVSVSSEQASATATFGSSSGKRYNSRRNKQQRVSSSSSSSSAVVAPETGGFTRRGFKPKVQASAVDSSPSGSSSLYKFKLNRSPGRWQYKTTARPRITIRKQNDEENETGGTTPNSLQDVSPALNDVVTPQARSDDVDSLVGSESIASIIDDESSTENKLDTPFPLETIKVEISTPPDFKDIYYEIATIKSPYTFQVGSVKNTRYITVTSTFEKILEQTESAIAATASEPLTENILATASNYDKDNNFLDSSVATLPPIYLASDMETPPLETMIEKFSTTQTMLKTHILPVIRGGNDTTSYTLVQTYLISRLVTATKTLPPMEAYHFNPSKTLNEFNSHLDEAGSELHLELDFGDQNEHDDGNHGKRVFPADLDLANIGSDFDLSDVDKSRIPESLLRLKKANAPATPKPLINDVLASPGLSPEQLQQLAYLRLLNPAAAAQGQVITASKPVVKLETLYETHVIPVINGANTILSTLSKIVGTVTKTDYEFVTSTLPGIPGLPGLQGLPLPPVPVNPLFPQQQPQYAVTSSPIVQTAIVTKTESKILKLTFGAKTAYTTIFSTKVVPTLLTTYMTTSVPVQQTAAFPGYYPGPYPSFPFVGK